jgi:hypothetical protein
VPLPAASEIDADTVAISHPLDELAALLSAARDESRSFELDVQLDLQASPPGRNSARDAHALADAITRAAVSVRDQVPYLRSGSCPTVHALGARPRNCAC